MAASQQADRGRLKSMLLAVRARVMEGHSLAVGLSDFPHVYPELYRTTVEAGEQSGHLDRVSSVWPITRRVASSCDKKSSWPCFTRPC